MLLVVAELDLAPARRLVDRALDRLGHLVGVHDDLAVHVAGGAPDRLDQRGLAAEEALLVRVEDRHERHLGQVEPLAQEVDADEHVVLAQAELADDLDPLERVDLGVEVARAHARLEQVVGQVLGHLLRQRRHEHPLACLLAPADLVQEVVDLVLRRPQLDLGVDDAGRADDLLGDVRRVAELERPGRRRDEQELRRALQELVEAQRPVVERRRQPEAVLDERLLARAVALVHAADLRHGLVRLVDEDEEVVGEEVEQRVRRRARRAPVEDPRVVLDPVAVAELLQHLEVVLGPLPDPVRLEQLPLRLEELDLLLELVLDLVDGALDRLARGHVLRRREDRQVLEACVDLAGERIEVRDLLDLVAEERDAVGRLHVRRLHLDDVAAHAEAAAAEERVVARVLDVDELAQHHVAVDLLADPEERPSSPRSPPASRGRRCTRRRRR